MKFNPRIKQHDITDCGPACLSSVFAWHGLRVPLSQVRMKASTDKKGTNLLGLCQAAEAYGMECKGLKVDFDFLRSLEVPAIAHILKDNLQHFVVVFGVCENKVYLMDPAVGKMEFRKEMDFRESWTGILLFLEPGKDFETGDYSVSRFQRFLKMLRPHRKELIPALLLAVFQTLLGISFALFLQILIDQALMMGSLTALYLLGLVMGIIIILQMGAGFLRSMLMLNTGLKMDFQLMKNFLQKVMALPQVFFDRMQKGEIISRFGDAVKIRSFISDIALNLFLNLMILICAFTVMLSTEWRLGLGMVAVIPLYAMLLHLVNRKNRSLQRKVMEKAAKLESSLIENIGGIRTIRHFGTESDSLKKIEALLEDVLVTAKGSGRMGIYAQISTSLVNKVFTVLVLCFGGGMVIAGQLSLGELMAFYALIAYFTHPVSELINANQSYQDAMIATDRLFEIQDLQSEQVENSADIPDQIMPIKVEEVYFSYGAGDDILKNISMQLEAGRIYVIAGESGSGKSTLARLLEGIYTVDHGRLLINGLDLSGLNLVELRRRIGTVPQQIELFSGSIKDNIALGYEEPDTAKIEAICSMLEMDDLISGLPFGFDTLIGEFGLQLSGGQSQLLAVARALYRDPDLLILDEATSAVDAITEEKILKVFKKLRNEGKTILLITHRMKNCLTADEIVVMREGRIIEQGSHQDLFITGTAYFDLWRKQSPFVEEFLKMSA